MISYIKKIFKYKIKYLIFWSFVSKDKNSTIEIGERISIKNSHISIRNNSKIKIHNNVSIESVNIQVNNGFVEIFEGNKLSKGNSSIKPIIIVHDGSFVLKSNNVFKAKVWVRFGGEVEIGSYNAINEMTEIRCDDKILIGDYNMISYECMIYDTNTHNIYTPEIRRKMTIDDFPLMGREFEKPKTNPVVIGNDCWLGKRSVLFKGTVLGDEVIIGSNSVVSNRKIEGKSLVIGNPAILINYNK